MSLRDGFRRWTTFDPPADAGEKPRRVEELFGRDRATVERGLWALALASFAADLALTEAGRSVGLVEVNPVARGLLQAHGTLGLVALKVLVLGLAAGLWAALPARYAPVVPAGLALPTVPAVVYNAALVTVVLL